MAEAMKAKEHGKKVRPSFGEIPPIDQVGIEERVARFARRSIKKEAKVSGLKMALNMIDLTTLEGSDTANKVKQICYKACHLHDAFASDLPNVAAVCVYPTFAAVAAKELEGTGVKVASVATAFPSGHSDQKLKVEECRYAVAEGAEEVDMVISRGRFQAGDYSYVFDEIAAIKEACSPARLKVILETGELGNFDKVRRASDIALYAGADFIKTSTGKISPAATPAAVQVMLEAIRDYYYKVGRMVGIKPAGGISTARQSLHYLVMVRETLGGAWLSNQWLRFGASRLANDILMQIVKERSGAYQSIDYFSKD